MPSTLLISPRGRPDGFPFFVVQCALQRCKLGTHSNAISRGNRNASRCSTMPPSILLTAVDTVSYIFLLADRGTDPFGVKPSGRCTFIPLAKSYISRSSGLSGRRPATRSAFKRPGARIFRRLRTIALKSNCAARKHRTSLSIYSGGKAYPPAHATADAVP